MTTAPATARNKHAASKLLPLVLYTINRRRRLAVPLTVRTVIDTTMEIAIGWYHEEIDDARTMGHYAALAWVKAGQPTEIAS